MTLLKIISGGQTGVDRAALDVALDLGIPCGGWCPKGRRAEDGLIAAKYPLVENNSPKYPPRTAMNVRQSDGTLILTRGEPDRGTGLTVALAKKHNKPFFVMDLETRPALAAVRQWIRTEKIKSLNVAGPRESSCPGIHDQASQILRRLLRKR